MFIFKEFNSNFRKHITLQTSLRAIRVLRGYIWRERQANYGHGGHGWHGMIFWDHLKPSAKVKWTNLPFRRFVTNSAQKIIPWNQS